MRQKIYLLLLLVAAFVATYFAMFNFIDLTTHNIYQHQSFVLLADFFFTKACLPGGIADYLSSFIEQFFCYRAYGAVLFTIELFVVAWLSVRYIGKSIGKNIYTTSGVWFLPIAIGIACSCSLTFPFCSVVQLMLTLLILNLQQAFANKRWAPILSFVLAVAVYHICGPMALYMFCLCNLIQLITNRTKLQITTAVVAFAVAALYPLVVYLFILPLTPYQAFVALLPYSICITYEGWPINVTLLFVYLPLSLIVAMLAANRISTAKWKTISQITICLCSILYVCQNAKNQNYNNERMCYKLSVAVEKQNWNFILRNYKRVNEEYSRHVNFCYNLALAKTNQLGDYMFHYPQRLGIDGMFLDKPFVSSSAYACAQLYYNLGLIPCALRFAYEAQTLYPYSPYVMRLIIDCLIIMGDYDSAKLFLNQFEHTMMASGFVADRRAFINGEKSLLSRSQVEYIRRNIPKNNFYTGSQLNNCLQQLYANPDNKVAEQYFMASLLLNTDLTSFGQALYHNPSNIDLSNMPRIYQEAWLIYKAKVESIPNELRKIKIDKQIEADFNRFTTIAFSKKSNANPYNELKRLYPHSYWLYYLYENPQKTKSAVYSQE